MPNRSVLARSSTRLTRLPDYVQRKAQITEGVTLTMFSVSAFLSLYLWEWRWGGAGGGVLVSMGLFLLNRLGFVSFVRWAVCLLVPAFITLGTASVNPPDYPIPPGRVLLFASVALPIALFDLRERASLLLTVGYVVMAFYLFEPAVELLGNGTGLARVKTLAVRNSVTAISFLLLLSAFFYFMGINARAERRIAELLSQSREANEELRSSLETVERQQADIADSIRYASRIQRAIMPQPSLLHTHPLDLALIYEPRDLVGGDFYWFHTTGEQVFLAAVDCTGHGVPGAFMSVLGSTLLSQLIVEQGIDSPAAVLDMLDLRIRTYLGQDAAAAEALDGMDLALVRVDFGAQQVVYAGANRPLLWHPAGDWPLQEIRPTKRAVGGRLYQDVRFEEHCLRAGHGTRLYLYTDGLTDQGGGTAGRKLGSKALHEQFEHTRHLSLAEQRDAVWQAVHHHMSGHEQRDDMLWLGVALH